MASQVEAIGEADSAALVDAVGTLGRHGPVRAGWARWRHFWFVAGGSTAGSSPLGFMWLGLASAAAPGHRADGRAALAGHRVHPANVPGRGGWPARNLSRSASSRIGWSSWCGPIFCGEHFGGNTLLGRSHQDPGSSAQGVGRRLFTSGGLTFVLALGSLTLRHGPPWRVWFSVIVVVSLFGSLGQYTSPIWVTRAVAASTDGHCYRNGCRPGRHRPVPTRRRFVLTAIFRDGDGGFYWWLSTVLPGFHQFRFPAKLFTFTTLGLAPLPGWAGIASLPVEPGALAAILRVLWSSSLAVLAVVLYERDAILASFRTLQSRLAVRPL